MLKDYMLSELSKNYNIAQFVSFAPESGVRYCHVKGDPEVFYDADPIFALLESSKSGMVNIRTFKEENSQGNPFIYGLTNPITILSHIKHLNRDGYYVIVNETIPLDDGGVSGVYHRGCIEFAPGVSPRFIENSDEVVASYYSGAALRILDTVYNTKIDRDIFFDKRVEFSVHPEKVGLKDENWIIWEVGEESSYEAVTPNYHWPNAFSKFIGDKAFGLLLAHVHGYSVPRTTIYTKQHQLVFSFGEATGADNIWTRTCPKVQTPGKFVTLPNKVDPYELMEGSEELASCLHQEEVPVFYSGAAITGSNGEAYIEGVEGYGDKFMLGEEPPSFDIPSHVIHDVSHLHDRLSGNFRGNISFEWGHDGYKAWLFQLHKEYDDNNVFITQGNSATVWKDFYASGGLEALRALISEYKYTSPNVGIRVIGNIGLTSHIADVLRKSGIPSEIVPMKCTSKKEEEK